MRLGRAALGCIASAAAGRTAGAWAKPWIWYEAKRRGKARLHLFTPADGHERGRKPGHRRPAAPRR